GHHSGSIVQPNHLHVIFTDSGRDSVVGDADKFILVIEVTVRTNPPKVVGDRLTYIANILISKCLREFVLIVNEFLLEWRKFLGSEHRLGRLILSKAQARNQNNRKQVTNDAHDV